MTNPLKYGLLGLVFALSGCTGAAVSPGGVTNALESPSEDAFVGASAANGGGEIGPKADKEGVITGKPTESPDNPRDATHGFAGDGDENGGGSPTPTPQENPDPTVKDPNAY